MVAESLAVTARRQIFAQAQVVLVDAAGVAGRAAVNRARSASMPQNRGLTMFDGWPNRLMRLLPAYSIFAPCRETAKDMSEG